LFRAFEGKSVFGCNMAGFFVFVGEDERSGGQQ